MVNKIKKYLEFEEEKFRKPLDKKTKIFNVSNKVTVFILGRIMWKVSWRKYCFFPEWDTVWDSKCLMEIIRFLDKLNKKT